MNLNDFVVLPNNKARSVKLNARNLQELRMETVTLVQESREMEEKLQQLRESMSREKEERGRSDGFRWKSGKSGALTSNVPANSAKGNKENKLQTQLSAGKVKIRVLKDEPLTAPPPSVPPTVGQRNYKLRGKICGQCEVKTAGVMCAECGEDYCIGCFARFHQKGALKLHRMIPIQTDIQTHVSTLDVVSRFQKQINPSSNSSTLRSPPINPNPGPDSIPKSNPSLKPKTSPSLTFNSNPTLNHKHNSNPKPVRIHRPRGHLDSQTVVRGGDWISEEDAHTLTQPPSETSQVLFVNHGGEREAMEDEEEEVEEGVTASLLGGEYDEEDSARSFQEALREWRGGRSGQGGGGHVEGVAVWKPAEARPVSVSAMATQADLPPDGGAGGGRGGGRGGRVPVRVEFAENGLTYLDRLLLKKHRRTPIETYRPLPALRSLAETHTEEETANSLTDEEEDFRRYCASLFAVPASRGGAEPQITTPGSCLNIEVLDETLRDLNGVFVGEAKTDNNRKVPSLQQFSNKGSAPVIQPNIASLGLTRLSPPLSNPAEPSKLLRAPAGLKGTKKLHSSKPQSPLSERAMKSLSLETKTSTCSTTETPRTSKASVKTSTSKSQKSNYPPGAHKSKPDHGSPQLSCSPSLPCSQPKTPESSQTFPLSSHDDSPLSQSIRRSSNPEECSSSPPSSSLSLRSTFTLSPSGSTELTLLPKADQSIPLPNGSKSPQLPKQSRSSPLVSEPTPSPRLPQSAPFGLASPKESHHSFSDADSPLPPNQPESPPSPVFPGAPRCRSFPPLSSPQQPCQLLHSPKPPAKCGDTVSSPSQSCRSPLKALSCSSLSNPSPSDIYFRYMSSQPRVRSSSPLTSGHKSTLSHQDTHGFQSDSPQLIMARQSPSLAVNLEEDLSLPTGDTGDEMSSDSLGLTMHAEDFSEEEVRMNESLEGWRAGREEQKNASSLHPEDSFVPVDAEQEEDLKIDASGPLSEPSMVRALAQRAGSGSEQFCDTDGFLTPGWDCSSGHISAPEYTHSDLTHTRQNCQDDSDTLNTGSISWRLSSNLRSDAEEHLVFTVMKNNDTQPTGIQIHSTTPIGRGENSAYELGTSGSWSSLSGRSTPSLSRPARTSPRPPSASLSPSLARSPSPPLSPSLPAGLSRPASGPGGAESRAAFRPLSRAAQEIMEICGVDQTGCEDPDLRADTDTHTLSCLERELRLMADDTGMQAGTGDSGGPGHRSSLALTQGGLSEEQKEEEEEARRDRQSVLSLP